jgi:2,5-diketo-D-gluconate reductase B
VPREDVAATELTIQGTRVPKLGFGTWQLTGRACVEGVADALRLGYRHLDTARMYRNEREVGRGLAESGVARDEVWITTKIWPSDAAAPRVRRSAESSLKDLGVDRVDLLLLHWPSDSVPLAETLGALADVREEGLAREIGVSNFDAPLLREALELGPVFADQVEHHPREPQDALLELCRERDVMLTAYSPFGHGRLLRDATLREIGDAHGKSPAQVLLRWLLDQPQVSAIPKAATHDKRVENLDVFDFELSDDERARIAAL